MKLISISQYDERSMQLAKPVYDGNGRILLSAGKTIHEKFLNKLKEMKIEYLFVEDAESRGITLDEMMDMPSWLDVIQEVKKIYELVAAGKKIEAITIHKIVGRLVIEVRDRKLVVLVPSTAISEDLRPYAHVVNVCLLSLQMGKKLMYNELQLRDLAIGSLLHDIGKMDSADESQHPNRGYDILRSMKEFNLLSAHVAFQHHEKLDGSGYPRGISGEQFLEYAQICGAANMYENMISKEAIPAHEAMERMMTESDRGYNQRVIAALVQGVPTYIPGTTVQLSNSEKAIVIRIDGNLHRPTVRLLSSENELSLEDHPSILIQGIAEKIQTR